MNSRNINYIFAILILLFSVPFIGKAQDNDSLKYWKFGGEGAFSVSQVSLTNWAAGGENTFSANAFLNIIASYKKNSVSWDNVLEMGSGMLKQGIYEQRKTDDKIDFASKFGLTASKYWNYSLMLGFKTQFLDGYDYPNDSVVISRFLAPAYVLLSAGMDYKPNDDLSVMLSPLSGRMTIVNDQVLADAGAFGVEPIAINKDGTIEMQGEKIRTEFGSFLKILYQHEVMTNVRLKTKLELFSNYLEEPQNIDINWEVLVNMKINKFLSANISTQLIYDEDIDITDKDGKTGPRTQFKEVFGIGLFYKF